MSDHPPVIILGCGYVGTRLAQSLRADGVTVRVCARRLPMLEPLAALGAEVHYFDASRPHQFGPALGGLSRPIVVYSIPGVPDLPQGEAVRRAATAASRAGASAFIDLSSSAVYGRSELVFTSDWVDEDASVAVSDADALLRLSDEAAVQSVAQSGLRTVILRLGAIYGPTLDPFHPARGARQRIRTGQYKLWDGGKHFFSRIYVDDLVRIIRAAALKAPPNAMYVVGDDHPCPQREYGEWLANHLNLPVPPDADSAKASGPRNIIRGRRLRNDKLKRELGLTLHYPSYREGELAIDAIEQGAKLPTTSEPQPEAALLPSPAAVEAQAVQPAPPAWPKAVTTDQDLGQILGGSARGVRLVQLSAGSEASPGPAYVLISGAASAVVQGQRVALRAMSVVPSASLVTAEQDALLLALSDP